MNVKLLEQVKAMILKFPEHVNMDMWSEGTLIADKQSAPLCGTAGCIAGWALAVEHGALTKEFVMDNNIAEAAAELLGLLSSGAEIDIEAMKGFEADRLFYTELWPTEFRLAYYDTPARSSYRGQVVADRIDHFIATGGKE